MSLRPSCRHALPALLLSVAAGAACAADWPVLPLPAGVQVIDVGDAMRINGLPMRVRGFLSTEPVQALIAWFRASLGSPLVTSEHGGKIILAQVRSGQYLTVQLQAAGSGTRGLVAQTDVQAMMAGRLSLPADDADWHARLPRETRILSLVQSRSRDGARQLQHLVLQSRAALSETGHALTRMLGKEGYLPARGVSGSSPLGMVLHFHGAGREAMAVLTQDAAGVTSTVLSTSAPVGSPR